MTVPDDSAAIALLLTDWGQPATLFRQHSDPSHSGTEWTTHPLRALIASRDLERKAAGHQHTAELTVLLRHDDLNEADRTRWLLHFAADPLVLGDEDGQFYEPIDVLRTAEGWVRLTLRPAASPVLGAVA